MVPPPLSPPLCMLPAGPGPPRFVCYCEGTGARDGFNLYVTDAVELWGTCFTSDALPALKARFGLNAVEDLAPRFRAACEQQAVTLSLQEDSASLTLSGEPATLTFELSKVPGPEAAPKLQALTLGLAERVCRLEQQLAAAEEKATSPRKSPRQVGPQLFLPDPDPQRGGPGPGVKRQSPGESLINPGFKRLWVYSTRGLGKTPPRSPPAPRTPQDGFTISIPTRHTAQPTLHNPL
ncbi:PREDICTED: uncharacterized protein C9orf142 homolog [Chrysochloris asiatica]|uniref:Uncharacterized protein C9orf142 homolog n=1 Tax=Chrysochloris asiatica TaxID=185453 RepID=A0A9B0TNS0_CHRAS|nr:PREDICTED: uncharacterized protein C9orf142 homolog [Chrysochloris asiatica]